MTRTIEYQAATFQPDIEAVGGSLGVSALVAAIPLLVLFVMLGALRITAWISGLAALAASLVVAVAAYSMPVDQALLSGAWGAAFGFFPILWIVINAIWVYNMTVAPGTSTSCDARSRPSATTCGCRRSSSRSASVPC